MTGKNQNGIRTEIIEKDEESTRTYIRDQLKELKESIEDSTSSFHAVPKVESPEQYVNGISKSAFIWLVGLLLTAILSLGTWIVATLNNHEMRLALLEENTKVMMEFRQDIKEIKTDINELKIKVLIIQEKMEKEK